MQNSYRFFANKQCEYYPCHKGIKDINCLFCYCPLYFEENCPGKCEYIETGSGRIKDCSNCSFPHRPENYEKVIEALRVSR